jgi:hypothetical protein
MLRQTGAGDVSASTTDATAYLIDVANAWPPVSHDRLRGIAEAFIRGGLLHSSMRLVVEMAIADDLAATAPMGSILGSDGEAEGYGPV